MTLADAQALFWRAITHPEGIEAFLRDADEGTRAAFAATFVSTEAFLAPDRMSVYANAYFWRLHQVLEEQFPVIRWLLGQAAFHNLVTDFVWRAPSVDPDLRQLGARLPEFGARSGALSPDQVHMAQVEWAMVEILDAPDEAVLTVEDLTAVEVQDWPDLRLRRAGTVRLWQQAVDFSATWKAFVRGAEPGIRGGDPQEANAVWRTGHQVFHRRISGVAHTLLLALATETTFTGLCARALNAGISPDQVARTLRLLVSDGLVRGAPGGPSP